MHNQGGGYVKGTAAGEIGNLENIANALDFAMVTVEYHLAPETTFHRPADDNYATLKSLHDNAVECGVDLAWIAVMGESAGGGQAALLAIAARSRGEVLASFESLTIRCLTIALARPVSSHSLSARFCGSFSLLNRLVFYATHALKMSEPI